MSTKGRGIVLASLVLIFLTAITVDRYLQTRARYPRGHLRQEAPSGDQGAAPPTQRTYFDPEADTELVVRLGGVRIPPPPSDGVIDSGRLSRNAEDASPNADEPRTRDSNEESDLSRNRAPAPPRFEPPRDDRTPQPRTFAYKVQPGESLSEIAGRFLDDPDEWRRIQEINGIPDPTKLRAGQEIQIPAR